MQKAIDTGTYALRPSDKCGYYEDKMNGLFIRIGVDDTCELSLEELRIGMKAEILYILKAIHNKTLTSSNIAKFVGQNNIFKWYYTIDTESSLRQSLQVDKNKIVEAN